MKDGGQVSTFSQSIWAVLLAKGAAGGGATLGPVRVVTIACYQPIIRIGLIAMPASLSSIAWFTSSNR